MFITRSRNHRGVVRGFSPIFLICACLVAGRVSFANYLPAKDPTLLRVSTARSAADLGLVRFLVDEFKKTRPGTDIKIASKGVLQVFEDGRTGAADLLITHHQAEELRFLNQDYGSRRAQIMFTEYAVIGPPGDKLGIAAQHDIVDVFRLLAENEVEFYAPSAQSGTNQKIEQIWSSAGISPDWLGYENTGASGYATLLQAAELGAYTVAEMGTYFLNRDKIKGRVVPLYRGDLTLRNIYSVIIVNPHTVPGVNEELATVFFEFLISETGQDAIRQFGEDTFKTTLLVPAAHLDTELRQRRTQQELADNEQQLSTQQRYTWMLGGLLASALILFVLVMRIESKRRRTQLEAQQLELAHSKTLDQNIALQKQIYERKKAEEKLSQALNVIQNSEAELAQEKERVEVTLHSIGDAVITTDQDGNVEYLNPMAERLTGSSLSSLEGKPISEAIEILDESDEAPIENPVTHCLREQKVIDQKQYKALRRHDGQIVPITSSAAPIIDKEGMAIGAVLVIQDVTPARKLAQELAYQATHDALTGLFNRSVFELRLQSALDSALDSNDQHVLCYLDLDQFKLVNDTCGHRAGDELLRQISLLLKDKVRDSDVLARLGGDELGILLMDCQLEKGEQLAQEVLGIISDYVFAWESHTFNVTASIGVVGITSESSNVVQIMSDADVACFEAKDQGRNRVHVYHSEDRTLEERRGEMQWVPRLTKALSQDAFELYVQPIVPVANKDSADTYYEVLIRLNENGQIIAPLAFLPAAERYNMMASIESWVVKKLFASLRAHSQEFTNHVFMLNVSGQSLGDETFLDTFQTQIKTSGIDASCFCVEITETAAITNLSQAVHFMNIMKAHGCRFALDDFGSGLSSFAYLKTLTVDFLKIDGSFVRDMEKDLVDRSMIESIINISRVVGTQTVAESVENKQVLDALQELGVDFVQGYFVGRPRPIAELVRQQLHTQKVGNLRN